MRNALIRAVLDCGVDDLSLLDDSAADMFKIVEQMRFEGLELTLNGIMEEIFKEGIFRMNEAVKSIKKRLELEEYEGTLTEAGYEVVETMILPDEPALLKTQLKRLADGRQVDLVLTSGGTGFSLRDQTPEATMAVADRNAPGIAEYIRYRSMELTSRAMLGRGVSVIRKKTLIVNLPGSPKAVEESLGFILEPLEHGLKILRGSASECARRQLTDKIGWEN